VLKLQEDLQQYGKLFQQVVDGHVIVGLDENSGLRGALRDSIHKVETKGKVLNNAALMRDMLQLRRNEKDFLIRKQTKYADQFSKNCDALIADLGNLKVNAADSAEIKPLLEDYKTKFLALVEEHKKIGLDHNDGLQKQMGEIFLKVEPKSELFAVAVETSQEKKIRLLSLIIYVGIGLLFLFFMQIYFFVRKNILLPINRFGDHIRILTDGIKSEGGDLTTRLDVGKKDEIGRLIVDYNYLLEELQEIFQTIKNVTGTNAAISEKIADGSNDLAVSSNQQAASVTQTAATLEEMSGISRSGSESIAAITADLDAFNTAVAGKTGHIAAVTSTMREIDASGKKIDNIVNVINDISFQTNLLALNAAVEAARAGEAGRGFAVVAAEVRNLAQKTAESSKTIQSIVNQNVESTQKGMQLVQETSDFFNSIVENIKKILDRLIENSQGIKEQTTGMEQITLTVSQLEDVINRNAALAKEFNSQSSHIKNNSFQLQGIVNQFKVNESHTPATPHKRAGAPAAAPTSGHRKKIVIPPASVKLQPGLEGTEDARDFFRDVEGDGGFEEF